MTSISTFLMFEGRAEEAMNFYRSVFPAAEVRSLTRHGEAAGEMKGRVMLAEMTLAGHSLMFSDSYVKHGFSFTPSISLFVTFTDETELRDAFAQLSQDGSVMMPVENYGFSQLFGWCSDRFGVSWQLNLPSA